MKLSPEEHEKILAKGPSPEAIKLMKEFTSYMNRSGGIPTPMQEAEELIYGDREKTYGDPSKNLARIAEMWTAYLNKNLRVALERTLLTYYFGPDERVVTPERMREVTRAIDLNISVTDVCRMMQHLKQSRDENYPKRDNIVDDIGYAGLAHRCRTPAYERSIPSSVGMAASAASDTAQGGELAVEMKTRKPTRKRKPETKRKR
jgi:hypothetical protein